MAGAVAPIANLPPSASSSWPPCSTGFCFSPSSGVFRAGHRSLTPQASVCGLNLWSTAAAHRRGSKSRVMAQAMAAPKEKLLSIREDPTQCQFPTPVLVIDNYDSFTYNLCQYLGELGCSYEVHRNDEITIDQLQKKGPCGILISPGPGTPQESGVSLETVFKLGPTTPLFGVCMGLQCIGEAFGGKIIRSPYGVMHGKKSLVYYDEHSEDGLLAGLPNPFFAGRYHSLVIDRESFPHDQLEITAWTKDGLIMGVRHHQYRHIQGVQFHPESIITDNGLTVMENFLKLVQRHVTIKEHLYRKLNSSFKKTTS